MDVAEQSRRNKLGRGDLADGTAISVSILCLVHCVALPALIMILPNALGMFAMSDAFHLAALGLVVPVALLSFAHGYRRHRHRHPAFLGAAGVALLGSALSPPFDHSLETVLTALGSLSLMTGHVLNWRLRADAA